MASLSILFLSENAGENKRQLQNKTILKRYITYSRDISLMILSFSDWQIKKEKKT